VQQAKKELTMDQNGENLRGLETLLNDFFSPAAGNERKREIETILSRFSSQETAWRDCLFFLDNSSNHFLYMYCLNTVEQVIQRRWLMMVTEHKGEVRTALHNIVFNNHNNLPPFVRRKTMKLMVDIAKVDWPHFYPDFFPQMLQLIHTQETILEGLTMLLIACEELGSPREDISTARAIELRKLMNHQVSHISLALTNILEVVVERELGGSTTPPPSPSISGDSEDSNSMDGTGQQSGHLLQIASNKVLGEEGGDPSRVVQLDSRSILIASTCLKCLAQIFSWANLPSAVNSRVISALFQFSSLVVKSKHTDQGITDISVLAMTAVNEIMAKNYVPMDFQDYLLSVYKGTLSILQGLLVETDNPSAVMPLQGVDEAFLDKLTDFLKYFVSFHLKRCEGNNYFPLLEFLSLMFKYSFMQPSIAGFSSCLEIWDTVVDYIQAGMEMNKEVGKSLLSRYQEALLSLVFQLLRKIQFRYNSGQLDELDTRSRDDNNETEWQVFVTAAVETIMKVADLLPLDVVRIVDCVWKETCIVYLDLEKLIVPDSPTNRLNLGSKEDELKLGMVLKDFGTLLRLIGRMSVLFLGEYFLERIQTGLDYVKQLLTLAAAGSRNKIYNCRCDNPGLKTDFLEVHAQTLASLKAWCHWLAALHSEALSDSSYTWVSSDITSKIVSAVVIVVKEGDNDTLVHAATHFLVTLTGTVRPPSIWKLKEFTDLYSSISHIRLRPEAHRLLVRSLCNVLLLHWPGILEQKWDDRKKHLTKFLRDITEDFRNLRSDPTFTQNKPLQKQAEAVIIHTLLILGDLVENVLNEVTQTKKLCHDTLKEYIDMSLWLFPLYIQTVDVCEAMFNFFHTVFDVLKTQMGSHYVEQAVQTFLSLFGENQLTQAIVEGGSTGNRVVEKFLSILTFIVSEPGPTFRKFVPSTLSLCLDHIYPLVVQQQAADIQPALYSLLYHTLVNNWQFFFKSTLGPMRNLNSNGQEEVANREIFLKAMGAFGQSFLQQDIAVFRQNMEALESLNLKWKLYSKQIFKEHLMAEFLSVLVKVLVSKSHNLLRDEITLAVYNMASTDFPAFFEKFLPHLLVTVGSLDENQQGMLVQGFNKDTDLPSFMSNLTRFCNDLRFYQNLNTSLPSGSVKF